MFFLWSMWLLFSVGVEREDSTMSREGNVLCRERGMCYTEMGETMSREGNDLCRERLIYCVERV